MNNINSIENSLEERTEQQLLLCKKLLLLDEDSREFEEELSSQISNDTFTEDDLKLLMKNSDSNIRYIGFYGLNILYRTLLNYNELKYLFTQSSEFSSHITYWHLETLCSIYTDFNNEPDEMESLLNRSYEKIQLYLKNEAENKTTKVNIAGYCHAFADLFATFCEKNPLISDKIRNDWYDSAVTMVNKAIASDRKYAKYYCTKGRIFSLKNTDENFDKAEEYIYKAIVCENSNRKDYAVRIGQYQYYRMNIQARKQFHDMDLKLLQDEKKHELSKKEQSEEITSIMDNLKASENDINKKLDSINDSALSNIEVLSFFAGIISFVLGSLSLANGQTATDAAGLIIVLIGGLTTAFSSFGFILHAYIEKDKRKYPLMNILMFIFGILIIIGGVIFLVYK